MTGCHFVSLSMVKAFSHITYYVSTYGSRRSCFFVISHVFRESQAAQQVNAALESLNIIPIVPRYDVAAYGTGSMKSFSFASDEILPAWWAHDPCLVDGDMSNCIGSCARSLQQIEATQCHFSCLCPCVCLCQCQCRSVFLNQVSICQHTAACI